MWRLLEIKLRIPKQQGGQTIMAKNIFQQIYDSFEFNIYYPIKIKIEELIQALKNIRLKRLYPDYVDDEYNIDELKFIWGVKSYDDLTRNDNANFHSMNDIEIVYDRKEKEYMLGIEEMFYFEDKQAEINYLKELLNQFTMYMEENNLELEPSSLDVDGFRFVCNSVMRAKTIEQLYTHFKIWVVGYCEVFGGNVDGE